MSKEGHYFLPRSEQLSYLLTVFLGGFTAGSRISYQHELLSARCLHAALRVCDTDHTNQRSENASMISASLTAEAAEEAGGNAPVNVAVSAKIAQTSLIRTSQITSMEPWQLGVET